MLALKIWNSLTRETRKEILELWTIDPERNPFYKPLLDEYHHAFNFDEYGTRLREILDNCYMRSADGKIVVSIEVKPIFVETSSNKIKKEEPIAPIVKQFYDMKKKHPDALLLFRIGDFYETYSQDAVDASKILGITLTRSNKIQDKDGKSLQMAAFPYPALDTYLPKLVRAGKRIAICNQIEEAPKQSNIKKKDVATQTGAPSPKRRKNPLPVWDTIFIDYVNQNNYKGAIRTIDKVVKQRRKEILIDTPMRWNHNIKSFNRYRGKIYASIYWQGDSTDGYTTVPLDDIVEHTLMSDGEYVIPADTFFDGERTRTRHGDIHIDCNELQEALKALARAL